MFSPQKPQSAYDNMLVDWLRLIRTENIGPVTFYRLMDTYGDAATVLNALPDIAAKGGRKKPLSCPSVDSITQEIERTQKLGAFFVPSYDNSYPLALSAIDDAPPILCAIGNIDLLKKPALAIIGARNASLNGKKMAYSLSKDLGSAGHAIISGLARGIDTAAHEGALETGTIAVIAGGIDTFYPEENQKLQRSIAQQGLILTEAPLGTQPIARHFPRRNRIVSGLSKGVIVLEATLKSGSLITARMAGEQGRDVYAVPGHPMDPRSAGPNRLIKDGATLVTNAQDILASQESFIGCGLHDRQTGQENFAIPPAETLAHIDDNMRNLVLENLSFDATTVDELIRTCHLNTGAMQTILLELELAGTIRRLPGNAVTRI